MGGRRGRLISQAERTEALLLAGEAFHAGARKRQACEQLGISLRTLERWEKADGAIDKRKTALRPRQANELSKEEKDMVLNIANSEEYIDTSPCKIVPDLADKDIYIASESTFYRILRAEKQLAHRHLSKPKKHSKPKAFTAKGPNQVWSWDISYLPSTVRGIYFYLYLTVDIFSRKIVGWNIHKVESSEHASYLIKQSCLDENVKEKQLVLHSDNGKPMKGITMLSMLETLGVMPSFSRPSVSDDNPYSESLFKTIKYHPTFPAAEKFNNIIDARLWMEKFTNWYNNHHMHSGLKFVTPQQRHSGVDKDILRNRDKVYKQAKLKNPARWSQNTRNWKPDSEVTLNPDRKNKINNSMQLQSDELMAA